jgi:hypothetical protein
MSSCGIGRPWDRTTFNLQLRRSANDLGHRGTMVSRMQIAAVKVKRVGPLASFGGKQDAKRGESEEFATDVILIRAMSVPVISVKYCYGANGKACMV